MKEFTFPCGTKVEVRTFREDHPDNASDQYGYNFHITEDEDSPAWCGPGMQALGLEGQPYVKSIRIAVLRKSIPALISALVSILDTEEL